MTDPIADMLTRIRNAYMAKKGQVDVPYSGLKFHLANKIKELGYVESVEQTEKDGHKQITMSLKYKNSLPILTGLKRISKPGRRVYTRSNHITRTLSGYGASIISTSKGVLTDTEARKQGIGGEIICQIW